MPASQIAVMRSAVGREQGCLIHVERFACLGARHPDGALALNMPDAERRVLGLSPGGPVRSQVHVTSRAQLGDF